MQNYNWNYPTTMWVGENRIKDLAIACKSLSISKPLIVTDNGLAKSKIILKSHDFSSRNLDLSEFVSVVGCPSNDPVACKTTPVVGPSTTRFWNSPSGLYDIALGQKQGGITYMTAIPAEGYASTGYGVLGCFNQQTGNVKVNLLPNKGVEIPEPEC